MNNPASNVTPYAQDDSSKKEQVRKMFDGIAPHYDGLNRLLSAGMDKKWRRLAISTLDAGDNGRILDVATGTGDLAFEILKQYPTNHVTGLDIADKMLDVARRKSDKRNLNESVDFVLGDSEKLPFENDSFDRASVAFGVRNFANLQAGLSEINRVLKPGGKLVVLEFTKPRIFPFKQLFNSYFKHVLPRIGGMRSGDRKAYEYLYESVQAFPDYERFTDVMLKCGFSDTSYKDLTLGICAIYSGQK